MYEKGWRVGPDRGVGNFRAELQTPQRVACWFVLHARGQVHEALFLHRFLRQGLSSNAVVSCSSVCHSSLENRRRIRLVRTAPTSMLATNNVRKVKSSVKNAS